MKSFKLSAAFLAASLTALPVSAQDQDRVPYDEFNLQTRMTLNACEYQDSNAPMPRGVTPEALKEIVGAIGYAGQAENFTERSARGLCGAFKWFLDNDYDRLSENECSERKTNDINYQICKTNDEIVLGPKGAWKDGVHEANRRRVASKLRTIAETLSLLEHGDELEDFEPSIYITLRDHLMSENYEAILNEGDCTTFPISARYDFEFKLCEENGELSIGKGAAKLVPSP